MPYNDQNLKDQEKSIADCIRNQDTAGFQAGHEWYIREIFSMEGKDDQRKVFDSLERIIEQTRFVLPKVIQEAYSSCLGMFGFWKQNLSLKRGVFERLHTLKELIRVTEEIPSEEALQGVYQGVIEVIVEQWCRNRNYYVNSVGRDEEYFPMLEITGEVVTLSGIRPQEKFMQKQYKGLLDQRMYDHLKKLEEVTKVLCSEKNILERSLELDIDALKQFWNALKILPTSETVQVLYVKNAEKDITKLKKLQEMTGIAPTSDTAKKMYHKFIEHKWLRGFEAFLQWSKFQPAGKYGLDTNVLLDLILVEDAQEYFEERLAFFPGNTFCTDYRCREEAYHAFERDYEVDDGRSYGCDLSPAGRKRAETLERYKITTLDEDAPDQENMSKILQAGKKHDRFNKEDVPIIDRFQREGVTIITRDYAVNDTCRDLGIDNIRWPVFKR